MSPSLGAIPQTKRPIKPDPTSSPEYPMRSEAQDFGMDTYAVELNHLVDTILDKVYRLAGNRTIFLASFSPEICILLSTKQHVYPVFFLTESGEIPSADVRAGSLQQAIHFAKSWRLSGVISRSDPFVMSPALIRYVKDSGLMCGSWGGLNDDPEHAKVRTIIAQIVRRRPFESGFVTEPRAAPPLLFVTFSHAAHFQSRILRLTDM